MPSGSRAFRQHANRATHSCCTWNLRCYAPLLKACTTHRQACCVGSPNCLDDTFCTLPIITANPPIAVKSKRHDTFLLDMQRMRLPMSLPRLSSESKPASKAPFRLPWHGKAVCIITGPSRLTDMKSERHPLRRHRRHSRLEWASVMQFSSSVSTSKRTGRFFVKAASGLLSRSGWRAP